MMIVAHLVVTLNDRGSAAGNRSSQDVMTTPVIWLSLREISVHIGTASAEQYGTYQHNSHLNCHEPPDTNLGRCRPTYRSGSRNGLWSGPALGGRRLQPRNISLQLEVSGRLPFAETFMPQQISRKQLPRIVKPVEVKVRKRAVSLAVAQEIPLSFSFHGSAQIAAPTPIAVGSIAANG
jgi:hypothetical protein